MIDRRDRIFSGIDVDNLTGLEIGPLANPLVRKNGVRRIFYADYANREYLRERSRGDANVNIDDIVDVDFVIPPPIPDDLGMKFDYIVSSHVAEHVPDIVGWLHKLARWLAPGGIITLATPDYRYCFDVLRKPSTTGEFIGAYLENRQRPPPSLVYDGFRSAVKYEPTDAWANVNPDNLDRYYTEEIALYLSKKALSEYVDCHCWVWTARSFIAAFEEMRALGITPLKIFCCYGPFKNETEFYVQFKLA